MKNLVGVFYLQKNENLCLTTMQYKCIVCNYAVIMYNIPGGKCHVLRHYWRYKKFKRH